MPHFEKKEANVVVAVGKPLELTGFYSLEHDVPGLGAKGDRVSEQQLREIPGFADPKDKKKDQTFLTHRKRLLDVGAIKPVTKEEAETLAASTEAANVTDGNKVAEIDDGLEALSKTDLLKAADEEGVEGITGKNSIPQILAAIRAKRAGTANNEADESSSGENE